MSTFNIQDAIYIDADTQNVGIGDTTPSYPLDVTGDINTTTDFNVGGVQVLSATALGSAVVSSSLTSVGTLSALTVSGDLNATLTTAAQTNVTSVGTLSALTVSGNLNATLTTAAQPNVTSVGTLSSLTVSGALDVSGDIDCNSNDITNVDNISFTSATIKGHMIPDTDDTYDIGSAQFKIRDMYVSDNSLWVGDSHKVSISGGKMKFRKRISTTVPAAITAAGGNEAGALTHAGKISLSLMKLHHWKAYMRTLSDQSGATIQDIFRDNAADYIEQSASDNWLETGTKTFNTIGNVGIGTADPSALLSLHYEPESSQGLKELLRLSWNDGSYDTLKGDGTKISFNTSNVNNSPGNVEGGYIGVMKANAVEANKACDYTVALNNGTSVVERLRILSTGYVGIGDSTPSYELDVTGDINLTGDLRINGTVQTFGGSSVWSEASSEAYYMGNVGIGTNNPSYQLDVRGNMRLGDGTSTEQDIRYISANGDWQLGTNNAGNGTSGNHFFLYEAGSYRFTVQKGTGHVGIGTNNPSYQLDMTGTSVSGILGRIQGGIMLQADENMVLRSSTNDIDDNNSLLWQNSGGSYTWRIGRRYNSSYENSNQASLVISGGGANGNYEALTDIMTFRQSNTFVGIKKRNPAYQLDVVGDINLTGDLRINGVAQSFGGGGGSSFTDLTETLTGQYGTVQTTAANGLGTWQGYNIGGRYALMSESNSNVGLYNDIDNQWIHYYNRESSTNGNYRLYTGGNERMRILSNGNIGVGTATADGVKMHISGKLRVDNGQLAVPSNATYGGIGTRVLFWPGSSSNTPYAFGMSGSTLWYSCPSNAAHRFYVGTSQKLTIKGSNVGIGQSNPGYPLEVKASAPVIALKDSRTSTNSTANAAYGSLQFRTSKQSGRLMAQIQCYATETNSHYNGGLKFYTYYQGTARKIIQCAGDWVGIGLPEATNPGSRLHVKQISDDDGGDWSHNNQAGILLERANNTNKWGMGINTYNDLSFCYNKLARGWINDTGTNPTFNFTGQHRVQMEVNNEETLSNINEFVGLIVSSTGTYIQQTLGDYIIEGIDINEALPKIKLTNQTKDKCVFGVVSRGEDLNSVDPRRIYQSGIFFSAFDKQSGDERVIVNSVGEGGIWVCNVNGALENGDYITTTEFAPGYGVKQDDDLLHNYTVAKITQNEDFSDMTNGKELEDGIKCKFVGCTYHCG